MTGLKRKPRFSECLGNERNPETAILALQAERTPDSDSAPIGCRTGFGGGWGVSKALEGFVTSLAVATWLGLDTATCGGAMRAVDAS